MPMSAIKKLSAARFNVAFHFLYYIREKIVKYVGEILQKMPAQTIVFSPTTPNILHNGERYNLQRMFIEENEVIVVADIHSLDASEIKSKEQFRLSTCNILLLQGILQRLSNDNNILE